MRATHALGARLAMAVAAACVAGVAGAAEVPDYSQGFARLLALGLPSAAGATYVRLSAPIPSAADRRVSRRPGERPRLRLKGNAWLLSESKHSPSRLITGEVAVVEVWDRNAWTAARHARAARQARAPTATVDPDAENADRDPIIGTWGRADLDRDIATILAFLAPPAVPAEKAKEYPMGNEEEKDTPAPAREIPPQAGASFFLFAAQCHSFGRTREANQIVQALFARVPQHRQVVSAALEALAKAQYNEHIEAFARSGDWRAWADALDALEARFRGVWSSGQGMKRLAGEVRQRATARPPALTGNGLTPEDGALATALAEARGAVASRAFYTTTWRPWLLPSEETTPAGTDPIAKIRDRGVAALPLLAALAADTYWTPLVAAGSRLGNSSLYEFARGFRTGTADPEDVTADAANRDLPRPLSRGQIAMDLLEGVVPAESGGYTDQVWVPGGDKLEAQKARAQRLAAAARAWQVETAGKTLLQVAELYQQKGTEYQRQEAVEYLLASGGEAAYPAVEAAILAGLQPAGSSWNARSLAEEYARRRGPAARGFVEKLAAVVAAPIPAVAAPAAGEAADLFVTDGDERVAWKTQTLPRLQRLVSPVPLHDILADVKVGKRPVEEAMEAIENCATTLQPEERLGMLLHLAVDNPDAKTRYQILSVCSWLRHLVLSSWPYPPRGHVSAAAGPPKLDPKAHAGLWRALLADERMCAEPPGHFRVAYAPLVRDLAAMAVELFYGDPEEAYEERLGTTMLPDQRFYELFRARAAARLDGKPEAELPPLPDAGRVSKERRAELLVALRHGDAAVLPGIAARLTLDEVLAVGEEVQADTALDPKLAPVANRIVKVTIELPGTAATAPLAALRGQILTLDVARQVRQVCMDLAGQGRCVGAEMTRAPALDGVSLCLRERPPPARPPEPAETEVPADRQAADRARPAMLEGACQLLSPDHEDGPISAEWRIPQPTPTPANGAEDDRLSREHEGDDEVVFGNRFSREREAAFWENVGMVCRGDSVWYPATISFTCRTEAEELE